MSNIEYAQLAYFQQKPYKGIKEMSEQIKKPNAIKTDRQINNQK